MSPTSAPEPAARRSWWAGHRSVVIVAAAALAVLVLAYVFRGVFAPLAVALALAYVLNPVMTWAARHRVPRPAMATILFLGVTAVVVLSALFVVPPLASELYSFGVAVVGEPAPESGVEDWDLNGNGEWDSGYLPRALEWAQGVAAGVQDGPAPWYVGVVRALRESAGAKEGLLAGTLQALRFAGERVVAFLWGLQGLLVGAALAAFYLFFFLLSYGRIVAAVRERLPGRYRPRIEDIARKIDASVAAFLRGRLLVCLIVGVLTAGGLAVCGVPYWFLLGFVTGVAGIVPYAPIFVGLVPSLLVAWFDSGSGGVVLGVLGVFVVVQTLEGWLITPLVQGKAVGLHPVTLTVALLLGYELLGIFGLVASVPLAATVKILCRELVLPAVEELADEEPDAAPAA